MEYFAYILLSIVILLVMVLIHEAGHYTVAKLLGFTVDEFAVGFGPKIFGKRRKNGEMFSLRLLPLGGFCSFYGEHSKDDDKKKEKKIKTKKRKRGEDITENVNADYAASSDAVSVNIDSQTAAAPDKDEDLLSFVMRSKIEEDKKLAEERARMTEAVAAEKAKAQEEPEPIRLDKSGNPAKGFFDQKPWKRILVLLGGVAFNFLSAIIFSFIFIWAAGYSVPQVAEVFSDADGNRYCAEMQVGDVILGINGKDIGFMRSYNDITADIKNGDTVTFKVLRDGSVTEVVTTCGRYSVIKNGKEVFYRYGFEYGDEPVYMGGNIGNAFKYCVPFTGKMAWSILGVFGQMFTGKVSILDSISGPVGAISNMAKVSMLSWRNLLLLLPLLASNLAIFNLIPFPALDGAHIVFTLIEWIRKKPINRNVEGMIHFVGMVVLLLFVVIVDILSFAL